MSNFEYSICGVETRPINAKYTSGVSGFFKELIVKKRRRFLTPFAVCNSGDEMYP
jgi:hypothetical protein